MAEEDAGLTMPGKAQAKQGEWSQPGESQGQREIRARIGGPEPCHHPPAPALHSVSQTSPALLFHHVWHQTIHVWHHRSSSRAIPNCALTGHIVVVQTSPAQAGEQVRARASLSPFRTCRGCWARKKRELPLLEVCIEDPVGESLTADADTFKDTVTPQLVQYQEGIHGSYRVRKRWSAQPKRTGEMELQHGPELWKQPMVLNMGVNLPCRPALSTSVAAWAPDGGSRPVHPCLLLYMSARQPNHQCTAKLKAWQNSFSPVKETGAGHRGFHTEMGQVSAAAKLPQGKGWGEGGCKSPCQLPPVDVTQGNCQGAVSVHAYLGSLSHLG